MTPMEPADVMLVHGDTWQGRALRVGQMINGHPSYWDHVAIYVDDNVLIEAAAGGIRYVDETFYINDPRIVCGYIHLPESISYEDRAEVARFAISCVGRRYGFLDCVAMLFARFTPLVFGVDETETCSSFVARALEYCGYVWETDPRRMTPGQIAERFGETVASPMGA